MWKDNVKPISADLDKINTILFRKNTYEYRFHMHYFFPYLNFIISSIPFSDGVPIPCDTSRQFGSNYIWVFQTREVFTSLEILLLNHHAYSVDQYENLKHMKNTFHQIDLLRFKILFDIRFKKKHRHFSSTVLSNVLYCLGLSLNILFHF